MGRHLGTHSSQILVGLGSQVGWQNGAKIDAKRHRKNDGKKEGGGSSLAGLGFIPSLIGGIPGPKTRGFARRWRFLLRLFWQSRCSSFLHRFSMPFWVDLGSGFPPNLPPKIDQNPRKIDAKMPSIFDSVF